jgi:hypothetical protein
MNTPSDTAPAAIEAIGRKAFATWDGVVSLGREYRMSEADKARWREKYRAAMEGEQQP